MFSIAGAVLFGVLVCIAAIAFAVRQLHEELGPTLRSFDLLHHDVAAAVAVVERDTGRARAGARLLQDNR